MKHFSIIFLLSLGIVFPSIAQEDNGKESVAIVRGQRIVQKNGEQWFYPTNKEKDASSDAYMLLKFLNLPGIRVIPQNRSISAADNRGSVDIRINNVPSTMNDMLALDIKAVVRIEYSDTPGLKYGENVGYAINIVTKRAVSGYSGGTNLTHALTTRKFWDNMYGRINVGKSEWGADVSANYNDERGVHSSSTTNYLFNDGSIHSINRESMGIRHRTTTQMSRLLYTLSDSSYVLQTSLSYVSDLRPNHYKQNSIIRGISTEGTHYESNKRSRQPTLNLYYSKDFRRHQSITANTSISHIHTTSDSYQDEGGPYAYHVIGNVWSLQTEINYENRLKPFVFSAGVNYTQNYTGNRYTGDALGISDQRHSSQRIFSQIAGKIWRMQYTAGLECNFRYYHQGIYKQQNCTLRPRLSLLYPISESLKLNYVFQYDEHMSQIAQVNNVTLRANAYEMTKGNPNLKPVHRTENTLRLTYSIPRFYAWIEGFVRLNNKCNMTSVARTDDNIFITSQYNQRHINVFALGQYAKYDIIRDKLSITGVLSLMNDDNKGFDYHHNYTAFIGDIMIDAHLGHWTLSANASSGYRWLEGEKKAHEGFSMQLMASYHKGPFHISLHCQNPFRAHPEIFHTRNLNRYVTGTSRYSNSDQGNYYSLSFAWRFSHGRKYRDVNQKIQAEKVAAGILTSQ